MILSLKKKEQVVHRIHTVAKGSVSAVVATLEGVSVNEVTKLRQEIRSINSHIYVVRNTLLRRVVKDTIFSCLKDVFIGQNIISFSNKIPSDVIQVFIKFGKKNESFKIKGAAFEGKFLDSSQISLLSNLPTYKKSLHNLIMVMKVSSIGNLLRVLNLVAVQK